MKPNVCIVVLDAVRASNLSCYGHSRPTSPNIDAVAEESIVFDRAVSPAATTLDSVSSFFSGLYPAEHQAGYNGSLSVDVPHLPELFSEQGYRTGATTTNPFITPGFGFEKGIDAFHSVEHRFQNGINVRRFFDRTKHLPAYQIYLRFLPEALNRNVVSNIGNALQFRFDLFTGTDQGAKEASARATDFFTESEKPWFLYAHYSEAHMKKHGTDHLYKLPGNQLYRFADEEEVNAKKLRHTGGAYGDEETRAVHERLYDATIRYLDGHVGRLVNELKRENTWEDTLFIVTADHGECLGEYDHIGHGTLYEPGVRVPLIVKPPTGMERTAENERERVNTLGLFSTLAELIGADAPHASVESVLDGRQEPVLVQDYCATWDWSSYGVDGAPGQHAIYHDETKLIQRGNERILYDLRADPEERNPLPPDADRMDYLSELLEERLDHLHPKHVGGREIDIDGATADRLEDLGYL